MTTVAKVFLVLLVIGAIALSTASITQTAQMRNWKQLAEGYRQDAVAAWAASVADGAQNRVAIEQLTASLEATDTRPRRRPQRSGRSPEGPRRSSYRDRAAQGRGDRQPGRHHQTHRFAPGRAEPRQPAAGPNQQALAHALDLEKRNIDLNDRVAELTANVNVLENQSRVLQQQNYSLKETVTRFASRCPSGLRLPPPACSPPRAPPSRFRHRFRPPFAARLWRLRATWSVSSVGSADGVRRDMAFVVYRGDKSVGRLTIRDVDAQASAGTVDKTYLQIQVGDQVINESGLMAQQ